MRCKHPSHSVSKVSGGCQHVCRVFGKRVLESSGLQPSSMPASAACYRACKLNIPHREFRSRSRSSCMAHSCCSSLSTRLTIVIIIASCCAFSSSRAYKANRGLHSTGFPCRSSAPKQPHCTHVITTQNAGFS